MSKKDITPVPGLHRVEERTPNRKKMPLAVKVTGRHIGAVAYLVSLASERSKQPAYVVSVFSPTGSLERLVIQTPARHLIAKPGEYVFLNHDEDRVRIDTAEFYESHYEPTGL